MGENDVFLVIFDTCDVYNLSISLLPPIVLDNSICVYLKIRLTGTVPAWFQGTPHAKMPMPDLQ